MAQNPIEKTFNQIGNAIESLFGSSNEPATTNSYTTTGQTCLEATGMRMRELHLRQNTWRRNDIEYSRPLVLAEYDIQTEFKISSAAEKAQEKAEASAKREQEKQAAAAEKKRQKAIKKAKKDNAKQNQVAGNVPQPNNQNTRTTPVETTLTPEMQMGTAMQYYLGNPTSYETKEGLHNWSNDILGE